MKKLILILLLAISVYPQGQLHLLMSSDAVLPLGTELLLPDTIYMAIGIEQSIYFKNLALDIPDGSSMGVSISGGTLTSDSWTWTPSSVGTQTLTITYNGYRYVTTVKVSDGSALSTPRELMAVGDSRTAGGQWVTQLRVLAGANLTGVGSKGTAPNNHEGLTGWTYYAAEGNGYVSIFEDGLTYVNMRGYLTTYELTQPHYVIFRLGTNDVFLRPDSTIESFIDLSLNSLDTLINAFHSIGEGTQIGVVMETPPSDSVQFTTEYAGTPTWNQYCKNIHRLKERLLLKYGKGGTRELSYVSLIPLYLDSDVENDFANGVHETTAGYQKEANTMFAWLKGRTVTLNDVTAPSAPTSLAVVGDTAKTTLTWTKPTATDLHLTRIYRGTSTNPTTLISTVLGSVETYVDTPLTAAIYYYRVKGVDTLNNASDYSSNANDTVFGTSTEAALALLADTNTVAWYKSTYSTKDANNKVTSWTDTTGLGHHLLQADTSKSPIVSADGITFNGVDDYVKATAFTLNQPTTVYAVIKQVSWTTGEYIWDGNALTYMALFQSVSTPTVRLNAGATSVYRAGLEIDAFGLVTAVYNGASSILQINNNASSTANAGTNNAGGFVVGSRGGATPEGYGNFVVKEIIIRKIADDATNQNLIKTYLNQKYSVY